MTTELPETTRLQPGQTLRMAVDPGYCMLVVQGCVNVALPPSWLGETMFSIRTLLHEGELYVSERSGWIEVSALSPAQVSAVPCPAPTVPPGASCVTRLVQLLTGRMAVREGQVPR